MIRKAVETMRENQMTEMEREELKRRREGLGKVDDGKADEKTLKRAEPDDRAGKGRTEKKKASKTQ